MLVTNGPAVRRIADHVRTHPTSWDTDRVLKGDEARLLIDLAYDFADRIDALAAEVERHPLQAAQFTALMIELRNAGYNGLRNTDLFSAVFRPGSE